MKELNYGTSMERGKYSENRERKREKDDQEKFIRDEEILRNERREKTRIFRVFRISEQERRNDELYD